MLQVTWQASPLLTPCVSTGFPKDLLRKLEGLEKDVTQLLETLRFRAQEAYAHLGAAPDCELEVSTRNEDLTIMVMIAVATLGFFLLVQFMGHRRRMAEIRCRTIESLAREGILDWRDLDRMLNPQHRKWKAVLVLAWFALIGGVFILVLQAAALAFPDLVYPSLGFPVPVAPYPVDPDLALLGITLAFLGTGIISVPVMLREMRKQGIF
ncbi:MAG: hypothetical protein ACE5F1_18255 [Planctomycetota bacterium]